METFSALLALCAGNSPHKGQWRGALMYSLICIWIKAGENNGEVGDLWRHRAHHDVIVMLPLRRRNAFPITDPWWRDIIGNRWISFAWRNDVELFSLLLTGIGCCANNSVAGEGDAVLLISRQSYVISETRGFPRFTLSYRRVNWRESHWYRWKNIEDWNDLNVCQFG